MVDDKKTPIKAWLYLAPTLILMAIFTFYPLINTIRLSFVEGYHTFNYSVKVSYGFANYIKFFQYSELWNIVKNTLIIVFVTVPLSTIIALVVSVALNSIKWLQKLFQTIFFIPYVTNVIAIGMVFTVMFNQNYGLVNTILGVFGIDKINWINEGASWLTSMTVLVIYIVWNALPFKILLFSSGLQSINSQYYDAAKIDSTPKSRVFWKITVPLLSPTIMYVLVTSLIGAFKEYSSIVAIFGSKMGPAGADGLMNTIVGYVYDQLSSPTTMGLAAAACVCLFIVIMFCTAINFLIGKDRVHY